jgi:hypothetical protein
MDDVDDWNLGPLMACSLHLDDIRDGKSVSSPSEQTSSSTANESQSTNLKDQIKLFNLYVSACELNSPRLEDSESSDESIHHGRDSCASSKSKRGNKSDSTFDSFLLKPGGRSSLRGASTPAASSIPDPPPDEDRRQPSSYIPERHSLTSLSFSGSACNRGKPASGSFKRSRPQSDSAPRPAPAHCSDYDVYKTQVIKALNSGKSVWL